MSRYLHAVETFGENAVMPDFAPEGSCQWCGKGRQSKRRGRFCPRAKRDGTGEADNAYWNWCYWGYSAWAFSRPRFQRVVLVRDDFTCQLCGVRPVMRNVHGLRLPDLSALHVDHVRPYSRGGPTDLDNLQTLCRGCNLKKGTT